MIIFAYHQNELSEVRQSSERDRSELKSLRLSSERERSEMKTLRQQLSDVKEQVEESRRHAGVMEEQTDSMKEAAQRSIREAEKGRDELRRKVVSQCLLFFSYCIDCICDESQF